MDDTILDCISDLKSKYPPIVVEEAPEATLNYDVNGPRLMISKIENENFKSYAGVKVLGPFHKNFTCVIGPNGSGKSNVIDALLFVFGFRASKIRSKKLSVLIHKSELFPNISSCAVRVYFQRIKSTGDRDSDFEVIPNSEFVVVRTAFKDNSSVYKINDKKANNKEVSEFLKNQGIDLDHNRFLILQGEVEQIAMMKPKATTEYEDGLLEYLEDIIGSHRFKEPLDILFKRLEELCDLRTEKLNRVKIVAKEKKDLESVRNEAVKYLRLCNEIVIRKNISFQLKLRDLRLLESTAVEKQNEVKEELQTIVDNIEKLLLLRTEKEKELKQVAQDHLLKMQQFAISQKQFHDLEIEDAELRDRRKHCKIKLEELAKNIKLKEKELIKYENVPEESVPRIEQLTKEIEKLEELKSIEIKNQNDMQAKVLEETEVLKVSKDNKYPERKKLQDLLTKQEAELCTQKCSLDCLIGNYKKEEQSFLQLESKLKAITEKIKESNEQMKRLNDDIPRMNEDYKASMKEIEELRSQELLLRPEFEKLNAMIRNCESKENTNKVIRFLFEQQSLGRLSGVYDRLGDLAAIDPIYDVAISTACGRLDSIVTDNMNTAQRSVELMKINNINRSTFIGLDKMHVWENRGNQPFHNRSQCPRAFDLLKIPNKIFRGVFYFALRDLLISKDANESVRTNQKGPRYRIVTLNGELTETSGAMTGGGHDKIRGKICTDIKKVEKTNQQLNEISNLDRQSLLRKYRSQEEQLNGILTRIADLERKLQALRHNIKNAMDNQKITQETITNLCVEEVELKKEIVTLQHHLKRKVPDSAEVKNLKTSIEKLERKYKADLDCKNKVDAEIEAITGKIVSISELHLKPIKLRLDATEEKIKEKSGILKKINMSVKNAEKICKRTTDAIEQLRKDRVKNEEVFQEMDVNLKLLENKAEEAVLVYQQTNQEVQDLQQLKDEHGEQVTKANEEIGKSKQIQLQINGDFEEKTLKVDQIKARIRQVQDDLKKLTFYALPDGVDEDEEDNSFMDLIGESGSNIDIFSSQKDSHTGTKLKVYTDEELLALKVHQITYQDIEDKLMKQKPNLTAIEEYRMKEELYIQKAFELEEVTQLRDYQRDQLEKLKRQRHHEFMSGFNLITSKLKEMYQMITMGGDAELELVDSLDPFSEGILFSVRPPKKSWKNISNLSGGEKTLSSLALVFALHHFKPTPFYVMDEIDAALDFKNVSIVATYLKERTKNAQFIIISLRNNMYELADRLVGIYKPFNVSKTCVVNPNSLSHCLKRAIWTLNAMNPPPQQQQTQQPMANSPDVIIDN